ncbi:ABC transporter ATP-binding protein [Arthrobacter bambusae]|uniref:ABC transporter ATP-binding protein n=1 Tax=Arthrobacter bambusae TaxID=1338426 RepID=UPI002787573E|nr:ABC transporter ATP-binding protein [Arthrobacter bambusae]MDQ0032141.1 ABC-type multidrug transport system ATPase subunit [Arthrobacter bambusae]MDQ0100253.1 ABC-type multidrug transport system ATPase subunit [Arthrobacter bambusae]
MKLGTAVLTAENLVAGYGEQAICGPPDVEVFPRQVLGMVGENGAGKSTLLRTMIGAQAPIEGDARVLGLMPDDRSALFRSKVSVLLDEDAYFDSLTVREHLSLVARGHGVANPEGSVESEIEFFELRTVADAFPDQLSSGQRRKLLLASAFIRPFELLVLDEPEQRLDTRMRGLLAQRIAKTAKEDAAVVMVTHDADVAKAACTRAVIVDDGGARVVGTDEAVARIRR